MKWNDTNYPIVTPQKDDTVLIRQANGGSVKSSTIAAIAGAVSGIRQVDSIAELSNVSTQELANGSLSNVAGYVSADDGGGGLFYYDASSSVAANGGTVIAPASNVGRWIRFTDGTIRVAWFGAVGDGVTDDSNAIQAAISALSSGDTLVFSSGKSYSITKTIRFTDINATVLCYGANFLLNGNNTGFVVQGTVTKFTVKGGVITGDGVLRDANSSLAQIGWVFGNELNAAVSGVSVEDVTCQMTNVCFRASYGTGAGAKTYNVWFVNCKAIGAVGQVGGVGYGFHFAQAPESGMVNCVAEKCGRHGMYFSEGRNYTAANCIIKNHRNGSVGPYEAFAISRSRNVTLTNCIFDNNYNAGINIDQDTQGVPGENVLEGVRIANCVFRDSYAVDINIGTSTPSVTGVPQWVSVTGCTFFGRASVAVVGINVRSGKNIRIENNEISQLTSDPSSRGIKLEAIEGDAYSDAILVRGNRIRSVGVGFDYAAAFITGASVLKSYDNDVIASNGNYLFGAAITGQTNNSTVIKQGPYEERRAALADTTPCVSGVDELSFVNTGATSVTNFDGGVNGQQLRLYFDNGNTTLVNNANIVLAGGVNFVGTAKDILTLTRAEGAWYEQSRSLN